MRPRPTHEDGGVGDARRANQRANPLPAGDARRWLDGHADHGIEVTASMWRRGFPSLPAKCDEM